MGFVGTCVPALHDLGVRDLAVPQRAGARPRDLFWNETWTPRGRGGGAECRSWYSTWRRDLMHEHCTHQRLALLLDSTS